MSLAVNLKMIKMLLKSVKLDNLSSSIEYLHKNEEEASIYTNPNKHLHEAHKEHVNRLFDEMSQIPEIKAGEHPNVRVIKAMDMLKGLKAFPKGSIDLGHVIDNFDNFDKLGNKRFSEIKNSQTFRDIMDHHLSGTTSIKDIHDHHGGLKTVNHLFKLFDHSGYQSTVNRHVNSDMKDAINATGEYSKLSDPEENKNIDFLKKQTNGSMVGNIYGDSSKILHTALSNRGLKLFKKLNGL